MTKPQTDVAPVVNNTQQVRASKIVLGSECRTKIMSLITPVIRAIIVWTVSSVKLLNNVVVGTGQVHANKQDNVHRQETLLEEMPPLRRRQMLPAEGTPKSHIGLRERPVVQILFSPLSKARPNRSGRIEQAKQLLQPNIKAPFRTLLQPNYKTTTLRSNNQ